MSERRSLIDGLKPADAIQEKAFVYGHKPPQNPMASPATPSISPAAAVTGGNSNSVARAPISTRIRADLAAALKRASLERQLAGIEPYTLQDILEAAVEPWLRANGYQETAS